MRDPGNEVAEIQSNESCVKLLSDDSILHVTSCFNLKYFSNQ